MLFGALITVAASPNFVVKMTNERLVYIDWIEERGSYHLGVHIPSSVFFVVRHLSFCFVCCLQ